MRVTQRSSLLKSRSGPFNGGALPNLGWLFGHWTRIVYKLHAISEEGITPPTVAHLLQCMSRRPREPEQKVEHFGLSGGEPKLDKYRGGNTRHGERTPRSGLKLDTVSAQPMDNTGGMVACKAIERLPDGRGTARTMGIEPGGMLHSRPGIGSRVGWWMLEMSLPGIEVLSAIAPAVHRVRDLPGAAELSSADSERCHQAGGMGRTTRTGAHSRPDAVVTGARIGNDDRESFEKLRLPRDRPLLAKKQEQILYP